MQKYEDMTKADDLAWIADISEKGAVNRRDFLKCGGLAALLGGIAAASNNCAGGSLMLGGVEESGPVHYPRLPGHKIQSPEHYGLEGCMVGYHNFGIFGSSFRFSTHEEMDKKTIQAYIKFYESTLNKSPTIMLLGYRWSRLADGLNDFPIGFAKGAAEESVIPFIIYDLQMES